MRCLEMRCLGARGISVDFAGARPRTAIVPSAADTAASRPNAGPILAWGEARKRDVAMAWPLSFCGGRNPVSVSNSVFWRTRVQFFCHVAFVGHLHLQGSSSHAHPHSSWPFNFPRPKTHAAPQPPLISGSPLPVARGEDWARSGF